MRNRIFVLRLFLSCLFMKAMFKNDFVLPFHQSKVRECLSPVWLQHQERHSCPTLLSTELQQEVFTQTWHLHGLQREESINIASWEALLKCRAGRYLRNGWEVALPLSLEGSTLLSATLWTIVFIGFGCSQPGRFLWLYTPGAWHQQRRELHVTETLPSSFFTCPIYKPRIPGSKMGLKFLSSL